MDYQLHTIDWHSDQDKETAVQLTGEHIAESLAEGGSGDGFVVAPYLITAVATIEGQVAAAYSYDPAPKETEPPAVELIYVRPRFRRQGLASSLLSELRERAPDIHVKSPLTAACAAVADRLGIPATTPDSAYLRTLRENARQMRRAPAAYCAQQGHRRAAAFQACQRCTDEFPYLLARTGVDEVFTRMRQVDPRHNLLLLAQAYENGTPQQRAGIERQVRATASGVQVLLGRGARIPGNPQ